MFRKTNLLLFLLFFCSASFSQNKPPKVKSLPEVRPAYPITFPSHNLMNGYLGMRYQGNLTNRLLKVDENELLGGFLQCPGKQRWIGEHVGKYLESAANVWVITGNPQLKAQMDRIARTLVSTQLPNGYLGTYLPENYWTSWDVWVHKYNMYGLMAYYKSTGEKFAMDAVIKIANLLINTFGEDKKDIGKAGSHVGMAATSVLDPMINLYILTKDQKYLDFCHYIIKAFQNEGGSNIIETLKNEGRVDKVANGKAYEMLSNILGIAKLYTVTGKNIYLQTAVTAAKDISANRLYISGTSSDHEYFKDNGDLKADTAAHMGEGCVTTTWLQLNLQLFSITGEMHYVEEMEKTIYNSLLAAENPSTGCVSYFTPMIGNKPYSCHITCCLSSVPRGIALIPYVNYGKLNGAPTLLLQESSRITDSVRNDKGQMAKVEFQVKSLYPEQGKTDIIVTPSTESKFKFQVRIPEWAKNARIKVNGQEERTNDKLVAIERLWKTGDVVNINYDIPFEIISGAPAYPNSFAVKRGAQILAVDESVNGALHLMRTTFKRPQHLLSNQISERSLLPSNWIGDQAYRIELRDIDEDDKKIIFIPFAETGQMGGFSTVWLNNGSSSK